MKNNMITIRKATPNDSDTIIDFQQKMALETENLALDRAILKKGVAAVFEDTGKGQYFVAEKEGIIIASLLITYEWSDWRNSDVWWFQSVYVLPGHRRTGVFRLMYSTIKEEGIKQGIAGLRLYVESKNKRAMSTYEALGMQSEHYKMYEWLKEK
jgi:GNAT superfamily N-acetyltransferase